MPCRGREVFVGSQHGSRQQILAYLAANGPIEDASGRATAKLKASLHYQHSPAALSQMLSSMERSGEIERTTKGKRTFRIAIGSAGESASSATPGEGDSSGEQLNYDELAEALLLRAVEAINAGARATGESDAWARRRIDRLERRNAELEQALSRAKAEARELAEQRAEIEQQLEHTAGNLALLTERLEDRPSRDRVAKQLGSEERELLSQLRRKSLGDSGRPAASRSTTGAG